MAEEPDINDQMRERRRALEQIVEMGVDPYPHRFGRTHSITQIVEQFSSKTGDELEALALEVRVAGRIHAINKMGKAAFIRFTDGREMLQVYIKSNEVDEPTWSLFKLLDPEADYNKNRSETCLIFRRFAPDAGRWPSSSRA